MLLEKKEKEVSTTTGFGGVTNFKELSPLHCLSMKLWYKVLR